MKCHLNFQSNLRLICPARIMVKIKIDLIPFDLIMDEHPFPKDKTSIIFRFNNPYYQEQEVRNAFNCFRSMFQSKTFL